MYFVYCRFGQDSVFFALNGALLAMDVFWVADLASSSEKIVALSVFFSSSSILALSRILKDFEKTGDYCVCVCVCMFSEFSGPAD